jgi:hypothetical protein
MKLMLAAALAAVLTAACASAPETEPAQAGAAVPQKMAYATPASTAVPVKISSKKGDPNAQVCRREQVLGSNYPKKICHSQAEWDALNHANLANAEDVSRNLRSTTNTNGQQ